MCNAFLFVYRKRHKSEKENTKTWKTIDENCKPESGSIMLNPENCSISDDATPVQYKIAANVGTAFNYSYADESEQAQPLNLGVIQYNNSMSDVSGYDGDAENCTIDYTSGTLQSDKFTHRSASIEIYTDTSCNPQPPEGRPILNTSLMKLATQNQQFRGRSPLTNVICNKNAITQTYQTGNCVDTDAFLQHKKHNIDLNDDNFHYYQKKMPQIYAGEGKILSLLY